MITISCSADLRLQYDPHAATRAYCDMWDAGGRVHTWVYVTTRDSYPTAGECSVIISNRMRDDIERALMVLSLKGEYL